MDTLLTTKMWALGPFQSPFLVCKIEDIPVELPT